MKRLRGLVLLALAALSLLQLAEAHAAVGRYAVIIGQNSGDRGEVVLRYAESDARRLGEVLRTVGGFAGSSSEDSGACAPFPKPAAPCRPTTPARTFLGTSASSFRMRTTST